MTIRERACSWGDLVKRLWMYAFSHNREVWRQIGGHLASPPDPNPYYVAPQG